MVFIVPQQHVWCLPSAQLKSSASNTHNKPCRKAPAKVITINVSGEIVRRYLNYLLMFSVSVTKMKMMILIRHLLIRRIFASTLIMIIMKEFLFSI